MVEQIVEFCHRGPDHAQVDGVDMVEEEFSGEFQGFEIRYR
jgi:acylphosphatase